MATAIAPFESALEEIVRERKDLDAAEAAWLAKVADYNDIALIVRHHHERVDGNGYPDRITETDIPLLSRIIAVADAYNAMTSDRPYREAMPSRVAGIRLAPTVGSQLDTTVVAAFEAILAMATEEYKCGLHTAFVESERRDRREDPRELIDEVA